MNPILSKIEQHVESKLPKQAMDQYNAIVTSGMQIMFSPQTRHLLMQKLQGKGNIVQKISQGIAQLIVTVFNHAEGKMQVPEAMPASITLAMHALDFADQAGMVKITNDLAAQVAQATARATMMAFGITQEKIQQVMAQQQGGGAQPATAQAGA